MNDDLHAWLDGEVDGRGLDDETRREAELWDRITASLRRDVPGPAPAWIETRVMAEIRAKAPEGRRGGRLTWLLRPRTVRLSPLALAGGLTLVLVAASWPWLGLPGPWATPTPGPAAAQVYVQFMLQAPDARSVAVSGDFNQWAGDAVMEDADGDGIWSLRIPMEPGLHEYMFVIDGERWITDPLAERYADDGFGNRNAVLAVPAPERSS
ncbi:MAG: glycoside hydrolase family 13 [Gemmatimonadetes bacterium]|nr:glycoside hydrolase family 13 [Gemmatimonadota bacterium]NNK63530.1 glycoside hydrolase family 13 [Gemmatimonadota bacterium]